MAQCPARASPGNEARRDGDLFEFQRSYFGKSPAPITDIPQFGLLYPYQKLPSFISLDASRLPSILTEYDRAARLTRDSGGHLVILDDPVAPEYLYSDFYEIAHARLLDHLARKDILIVPLKAEFDERADDEDFLTRATYRKVATRKSGTPSLSFFG
ncbi:MAG: hypothetical protein M5R36_15985 [Deltaproteobacteria bacterium]|nr:hypothetical protein [Deltaproteobacteria bacterium]